MTSGAALRRTAARDAAVEEAVLQGLLGPSSPVIGLLDVDGILAAVADLRTAFDGAPVQHAFAVKACALVPVLRLLAEAGLDCEVASLAEVELALAAGLSPGRLVFDSPAKTVEELEFALAHGITMNADNFQELARIDALLTEPRVAGPIGLRVNPQVGAGSVESTSTATATSKFGVALRDGGAVDAVVDAFARYPWLNRIHAHVGSLACPLPLMAAGVAAAYELAEHINTVLGRRQVTSLDIGGGLPVSFTDDEDRPTFADYVAELRTAVPDLFDGRYALTTEFGRSLVAKSGSVVSVVEYTKTVGGRRIAITHAGAQIVNRAMSMPKAWPLRVGTYGADGRPKNGPTAPHDLAGPLCFAGDLTVVNRELTVLEPGDVIALYDTGAYSVSTHFSYNSLPRAAVHGYRTDSTGAVRFAPIRAAQTVRDVVAGSGTEHADALTGLIATGESDGSGTPRSR